jgi:3-hydroxybutyryl-CoA dehydrogenase
MQRVNNRSSNASAQRQNSKHFVTATFVIEAVVENLGVKTDVFKSLDKIAPARAILASNTSSISITKLGAATSRPDKVIGMHFMNPVPVMKLIEVIRGIATSDETYERVRELSEKMDKIALDCQDSPGSCRIAF